MLDGVIIIALLGLLAYQQWLHHRQVRDLTLKIKAPTVHEYIEAKQLEDARPSDDVPEVAPVPLDQLDPDKALRLLNEDLNRGEEAIEE